jgi:hypothetical protein
MTVSEVVAGLTVNKSKFERFRGAETARTALPIRQNRSRVHLHQKHQKSTLRLCGGSMIPTATLRHADLFA